MVLLEWLASKNITSLYSIVLQFNVTPTISGHHCKGGKGGVVIFLHEQLHCTVNNLRFLFHKFTNHLII